MIKTEKQLINEIKTLNTGDAFWFNGFEIYNNGKEYEYFHNSMDKMYSKNAEVVANHVYNFKYKKWE